MTLSARLLWDNPTVTDRGGLAALAEALARSKGEALAPATVCLEAGLAHLHTRRRLAQLQGRGLANVRFMPLFRVAELLGGPEMAAQSRTPASPLLKRAIARHAMAQSEGSWADVADSPEAVRSVARALDDLDRLHDEDLPERVPKELRGVFIAYRGELRAHAYDRRDLALAAAQAVLRGDSSLDEFGPVLLRARPGPSPEAPLVEALQRVGKLVLLDPPPRPDPERSRVWLMPDDEVELREVGVELLRLAHDGVPFGRVAVLGPDARSLTGLAQQVLVPAGIAIHARNGPTLASTPEGRAFLGWLNVPDRGWVRHEVVEWLGGAGLVDAPTWDRVTIRAGVIRRAEQWRARLGRREDSRSKEVLSTFEGLVAGFERAPSRGTWEQHLAWAESVVPGIGDWMKPLAGLSVVQPSPTRAEFRDAAIELLRQSPKPVGKYGEGVFVAGFSDAVGLEFDAVFLVGLQEGSCPPATVPDAVLGRSRRRRLGLPDPHQAALDDWSIARSCATEAVFSASRVNAGARREVLPSPWLTAEASRLAGRRVGATELGRVEEPWLTVRVSFVESLARRLPLDEVELRLRSGWVRPRVLEMASARASMLLTEWDGYVPEAWSFAEPLPVRAMETFGACPYRFFLSHVLGLHPDQEADDELQLDRKTLGTVLHGVLARWRREPGLHFRDTLEQALDELVAEGAVVDSPLWRGERDKLILDLTKYVETQLLADPHLEVERPVVGSLDLEGLVVPFSGRVDRMDGLENPALIVDYKTGGTPKRFGALNPTLNGTLLQLAVYGLLLEAEGKAPERLAYHWVREGTQDELEFEEVAPAARDVLAVWSRAIQEGLFPAIPGSREKLDEPNCQYCDFRDLCPRERARRWASKVDDRMTPVMAVRNGAIQEEPRD